MAKTFFVAARNSRHRVAALALYRALLRTSRQISLPEDVLQAQKGGHPVTNLVRKRFEGNKSYTSLRLVYSSMAAGYKFLTMLKKAQMPESTEHAEVVEFLRKRKEKSDETRAQKAAQASQRQPRKPEKPRAEHTPLLTNVADPTRSPRYIANPPTSDRQRRVPHFAFESHGYPFLRYSKPQPERLSQMIRRNGWLWEKKIEAILAVEEEWAPDALLEDQWEEEVRRIALREGGTEHLEGGKKEKIPPEETFLWSTMTSKLWFEWRLENMWEHWTARGEALQKLIQDERASAREEAKGQVQREPGASEGRSGDKAQSDDDLASLVNEMANLGKGSSQEASTDALLHREANTITAKKPAYGSGTPNPKVVVPKQSRMVALHSAKQVMKDLDRQGIPWQEREGDLFSSPVWKGLAERESSRIARWANTARGIVPPARGRKGEEADLDDGFASMIKAQAREI